MEGAGAVFAENEVLHWLAHEFGLPATAGGVFVQGGTIGNLSALVTARESEAHHPLLPATTLLHHLVTLADRQLHLILYLILPEFVLRFGILSSG